MRIAYVFEIILRNKNASGIKLRPWVIAGTFREAGDKAWRWFDRTQNSSREDFEIDAVCSSTQGSIDEQ